MRETNANVAYMLGVLAGALSGAAATLLWTPLSGREARAYLGAVAASWRAVGRGRVG